jgi:hypothetical protein
MPFRYSCPRCRTVLQCEDRAAGSKHPCPTCGRRLRVPAPPVNKTMPRPNEDGAHDAL